MGPLMLAIKLPMVMYGPIETKERAVDGLKWAHWRYLMELLNDLNGPTKLPKAAVHSHEWAH
jgi:hypothetical protein